MSCKFFIFVICNTSSYSEGRAYLQSASFLHFINTSDTAVYFTANSYIYKQLVFHELRRELAYPFISHNHHLYL